MRISVLEFVVLRNYLRANPLERIYWKGWNILMTLTVHELGLRNFQKAQKERHNSDLAVRMIQMKHWVLRRLKMGPEELALLVHRSSETVGQKQWEHHNYRKEYRHCRKDLHSEHHSCLMVWTALCNSVKKRHLQTFQNCQRARLFVKKILQNMNWKKVRRNLAKVLQVLRNLLMVETDLNTLRYRSIQREC